MTIEFRGRGQTLSPRGQGQTLSPKGPAAGPVTRITHRRGGEHTLIIPCISPIPAWAATRLSLEEHPLVQGAQTSNTIHTQQG